MRTRMSVLATLALPLVLLPASAGAMVRTGTVERVHSHQRDGTARHFYALTSRTALWPLSLRGVDPAGLVGKRVRVTGHERAGRLTAGRRGVRVLGPARPVARAAASTRDAAIFVISFTGEADHGTYQEVNGDRVEKNSVGPTDPVGYSLREYFASTSYGGVDFVPQVWRNIDLGTVPDFCNLALIAQQAIAKAEAIHPGFDADVVESFVYMHRYTPKCSSAGVGGGSQAWVNGESMGVAIHEIGHGFDAPHAGLWRCVDGGGQPVAYSGSCQFADGSGDGYGDPFDPMGGGGAFWYPPALGDPAMGAATAREMDVYRRTAMGGISPADYPVVNYSGTYQLAPAEAGSGVRMLRLPNGTGEFFDLTFRRGGITPFDTYDAADPVANGVSVRLDAAKVDPNVSSRLLDFTPGSQSGLEDWKDGSLRVGQSFTVSATGARATVTSVSQSGAVVAIDGLPPPPASGGGPPAAGAPGNPVPVISTFALTPSTFSPMPRGGSLAATKGTRVRYALSEAATVRFTVSRPTTGRRVGRRCVKPTRANRRRAKCTRYAGVPGTFTHRGKTGANSFRFTGRLKRRPLARGRYRLTAVATDSARQRSRALNRAFRIVR